MNGAGTGCIGGTRVIKAFAIACPSEVRTQFQAPAYWFDSEGYLNLYIAPGEWAPKDVAVGGSGEYEVTFRRLRRRVRKVIRGYQITVAQSQAKLYYVVQHLGLLCDQTPHTPILVKDFVSPEGAQYSATLPSSEPYTLRAGTLYDVQASGGMTGTFGDNLYIGEGSGGFTFSFQEAKVTDVNR